MQVERKVNMANGWAMAEGLISVFMKVGQKDPHTIVFCKLNSQADEDQDSSDRHGFSPVKSKSPGNFMLSVGSSRQSYFIEKTLGAKSESKSTLEFSPQQPASGMNEPRSGSH